MKILAIFSLVVALALASENCGEEAEEACVNSLYIVLLGDTVDEEVCSEIITSISCLTNVSDECQGHERIEKVEESLEELHRLLKENCGDDEDVDEMQKCLEENQDYFRVCIRESTNEALSLLMAEMSLEIVDDNHLQCLELRTSVNCLEDLADECLGAVKPKEVEEGLEELNRALREKCSDGDDDGDDEDEDGDDEDEDGDDEDEDGNDEDDDGDDEDDDVSDNDDEDNNNDVDNSNDVKDNNYYDDDDVEDDNNYDDDVVEDNNSDFEDNNSYFEDNNSYFEDNNSYFEDNSNYDDDDVEESNNDVEDNNNYDDDDVEDNSNDDEDNNYYDDDDVEDNNKDIEDNSNEVENNNNDIEDNSNEVENNNNDIEDNSIDVENNNNYNDDEHKDDNDDGTKTCFEENKDYIHDCINEGSDQIMSLAEKDKSLDNMDDNTFKCLTYKIVTNCFVGRIREKCGSEAASEAAEEFNDAPPDVGKACRESGDIISHALELLEDRKK